MQKQTAINSQVDPRYSGVRVSQSAEHAVVASQMPPIVMKLVA